MSLPELGPGHVVSQRYVIVGSLASRGSSAATAVYQATDSGRTVALRVLDPALGSRGDVLSALHHVYGATNALPPDAVVPIVDANIDRALGTPYVVSEYVTDPPLDRALASGLVAPDHVSALLSSLARCLDNAHARQLLHGALRPSKVFVGQRYSTRIADFAASLVARALPTHDDYARAAPWLAPEQIAGGAQVGPAADVFTCALLAFYALTGRSYWRSCQGAVPDLASLSREVLAPRAPTSTRATELGAQLPASLDAALGHALNVDANARFRSVGEFAASVAEALAREAPQSSPTLALVPSAFDPQPSALAAASPGRRLPAPGEATIAFEAPNPQALPPAQQPQNAAPQQAAPPQIGPYVAGAVPQQQGATPQQAIAPQTGPYVAGAHGEGAPGAPHGMPGATGGPQGLEQGSGFPGAVQPAYVSAPPPPKRSPAPIVAAAVGAAVLLGGAVLVFALTRSPSDPTVPSAEPIAATGAASASAPAAEVPAALPSDPPSAAPSVAEAPPEAPSAEPSSAPAAEVELVITCGGEPCDSVKVDGVAVSDPGAPIKVSAGPHKISAKRSGFAPQEQSVDATAPRAEVDLKMVAAPSTKASTPPKPKPCGKFIKKC